MMTSPPGIYSDMIVSKELLRAHGIKVLDDFWFYGEAWIKDKNSVLHSIKTKFQYPLIVKPVTVIFLLVPINLVSYILEVGLFKLIISPATIPDKL